MKTNKTQNVSAVMVKPGKQEDHLNVEHSDNSAASDSPLEASAQLSPKGNKQSLDSWYFS